MEVTADQNALRNARQLYRVLSYVPKERKNEEISYVDESALKRKTIDYEFAYADLRSVSLLIGMCRKYKYGYQPRKRGILVRSVTKPQINEMRKRCNKHTHRCQAAI